MLPRIFAKFRSVFLGIVIGFGLACAAVLWTNQGRYMNEMTRMSFDAYPHPNPNLGGWKVSLFLPACLPAFLSLPLFSFRNDHWMYNCFSFEGKIPHLDVRTWPPDEKNIHQENTHAKQQEIKAASVGNILRNLKITILDKTTWKKWLFGVQTSSQKLTQWSLLQLTPSPPLPSTPLPSPLPPSPYSIEFGKSPFSGKRQRGHKQH